MFNYVCVIEGQSVDQGLRYGSREAVARRVAVEVYANHNANRMVKRSVDLIDHGFVVDRLDAGKWLSGYQPEED
jgi:hypothetical protein